MSTIIASNISDGTTSVASTYVVNGSAKAWVNFNGIGTVAIRDSLNVGSITDIGTGDYTVNFTTAMLDANYAVALTSGYTTNAANPSFGVAHRTGSGGNESVPTTSSFRMCIDDSSGNVVDTKYANAAIFR
jgi:hypothetical protein